MTANPSAVKPAGAFVTTEKLVTHVLVASKMPQKSTFNAEFWYRMALVVSGLR
jgi:hypothetical protein